jgi:hypothetical protein
LIHLPKDHTLNIDGPERVRYDTFEGSLLTGAFTKLKTLRHQNPKSFLPGEYFKRIEVKPYIAQAAEFKRNPSSFHASFV